MRGQETCRGAGVRRFAGSQRQLLRNAAILTSAQKAIDVSVLDFYNQVEGGYLGGTDYSGTIANKGVLLSPFHDFDSKIPADLKAEIATLQTALGNGSVTVCSFLKRGC